MRARQRQATDVCLDEKMYYRRRARMGAVGGSPLTELRWKAFHQSYSAKGEGGPCEGGSLRE
jgi:hypothetical protein